MADSLVTDLAQMHDMATRLIPNLASEFAAASHAVNSSRGSASEAMAETYSPWESVSSQLQKAFSDTSTSLYDAGTVLANAADDFAKKDGVHAQWLDKNRKRIADGVAGPPAPTNPVKPVKPVKPGPSNGDRDGSSAPPWEQSA